MKYLLDTNVIIDFLNGQDELAGLPEILNGAELYASSITRMELLSHHRLAGEDEPKILNFLDDLIILPIDQEVERAAIALRRGARLKLPDAIIAATAWLINATLVTRDRRLAGLAWPGLMTMTF